MSWLESYKPDLKWGVVVLLIAVLGLTGGLYGSWNCPVGNQAVGECARGPGTENLSTLASALLSPDGFVLALELLGILLVAALIGALVIALRDKPEDEEGGEA